MIPVKTRFIDITCACVKKWTGPTQPSTSVNFDFWNKRIVFFVGYSENLKKIHYDSEFLDNMIKVAIGNLLGHSICVTDT